MTSQTDVVNMTSSRQKENGKLRQGKWQAMNKVSETKERRNLNTNSHFETSSSKLKFRFPGLVNISWLFVLMCCLLMVVDTSSGSANFRQREQKILDAIIGPESTYDKRVRPDGANDTAPAIVDINVKIRNIQAISEVNMEYDLQMTFREQWTDSRLIFDNMGGRIQYLSLRDKDALWMPDLLQE
ncbi:Glutamate-gated chloride channel, partial [Armadillidium vulgare]